MLTKLLIASGPLAVCVAIHATGVTSAVRWLRRQETTGQQFWFWTWLFVRLAGWIVLLHLIEITVWACTPFRATAKEVHSKRVQRTH